MLGIVHGVSKFLFAINSLTFELPPLDPLVDFHLTNILYIVDVNSEMVNEFTDKSKPSIAVRTDGHLQVFLIIESRIDISPVVLIEWTGKLRR